MVRGRAAGYDHQRELILAHAAELFARHGYASASMNQVAEACGMSKAAVYHYYRDKYAMLVELTECHVKHLHAIVESIMARDLEPRTRLRVLITEFVEAYAGAQHAHRVLTEDTRFLEPADRERVLAHERKLVAAFAKTMAAYRPELDEAQLTKPMTMLLFGMINWMFTWLKRDGPLNHETIAPIVTDFVLGGLPAVAQKHGVVAPSRTARPSRAMASNKLGARPD